MGKPTGQHPFPITLTQNPKRCPKVDQEPVISALPGAPSLTGCQSTKTINYDQVFLKTWSRANTLILSRVTNISKKFAKISFYHILRENNEGEDGLDNKVTIQPQGKIKRNGVVSL
jgi:hypothetical protein